MPLILLEKFKEDTSVGGDINKRGSALIHVDVALEAWHKNKSNNPDTTISLLYNLIKQCNKWYQGTKPPKGQKAFALYL